MFLVKVAPGAGVILLGATQRRPGSAPGRSPSSSPASATTSRSGSGCAPRAGRCRSCASAPGAYSEGLDTSTLLPQYKGVGILRGATDASPTVRTYLADGQDAEKILTAARALRERAGTLSGMAAGVGVATAARDVLADVLAVFGGRQPGCTGRVLAERLAARFPDRWADATGEAVSRSVPGAGRAARRREDGRPVGEGLPPRPTSRPRPGRGDATVLTC